jgi:hypothetical protein
MSSENSDSNRIAIQPVEKETRKPTHLIVGSTTINTLRVYLSRISWQPIALFIVCLVVMLRTMAPTVYELDSAELATGAATLGIVHPPGYPLYTLVAHLFTLLPLGDVAFRVNLLSVICLTLAALFLYSLLVLLIRDKWIAVVATLMFTWSYFIWQTGTAAEVYAPQLLSLALCGWSLAKMYRDHEDQKNHQGRGALRTGFLFGVAVAVSPPLVLFALGLGVAFIFMRVPWRKCVLAALISAVVFLSTLLYFPIRYAAQPQFNKIGQYEPDGSFKSVNFDTVGGIWSAISGQEFHSLFFSKGYLPTLNQLTDTVSWFWSNYLGIGIVLGIIGAVYLYRKQRALFICWLAFFAPYTYFYICYGASDRDTMFGGSYLVWAIVLAFGVKVVVEAMRFSRVSKPLLLILPSLFFVANFHAVDLSNKTSTREYSENVLDSLPPNAVAVGYWAEVAPLQYLHYVEGRRPDVKILDLFLFDRTDFHTYLDSVVQPGKEQVVFVTSEALTYLMGTHYAIAPTLIRVGDEPIMSSYVVNFEVAMAKR